MSSSRSRALLVGERKLLTALMQGTVCLSRGRYGILNPWAPCPPLPASCAWRER